MEKIPCQLDVTPLLEEIKTLNFYTDDTGVEMAFRQSNGLPINTNSIFAAVREIALLRNLEPLHVMINKMGPGVMVPWHRDYLKPTEKQGKYPCLERWHLPLTTNNLSWFHYGPKEKGLQSYSCQMKIGSWYGPVEYWRDHSVDNLGETERIHLIVDLDSERIGNYE